MRYVLQILSFTFLLALTSCFAQDGEPTTRVDELPTKAAAANTNTNAKVVPNRLFISTTSYRGITPGSEISMHAAYMQKAAMKTPEGTFDIYKIKDYKDGFAGYFLADPRDETKVGDIVIDVERARTLQGIHVGSTFAELLKLPELSVHGSEMEGKTYALQYRHSYRLDIANFSYDVDINSIPADTKVTEIRIKRK